MQDAPIELPTAIEGRRLALADWIAAEKNPLTARVMVNRIWLWHFGQALAGNPNNFGATGRKPTHPELLDWLAATFIERGWSVKAMHRLIMNSNAYRRAAQHPEPARLAERSHKTSYAVFSRRLGGELRDTMLRDGRTEPHAGRHSVRPNSAVALQPRQVMHVADVAALPDARAAPAQPVCNGFAALATRSWRFSTRRVRISRATPRRLAVTPQVFSMFNSGATSRSLAFAPAPAETKSRDAALSRVGSPTGAPGAGG